MENYIDSLVNRRSLLPIWIKIFLWIFMFFGVLIPVGILLNVLFGLSVPISLYGLSTMHLFSAKGLFLTILFGIKAFVSFGLWTEKEWAVNLAIIDAVLGILICISVMLINLFLIEERMHITIRLELVALIPYLIKMRRIMDHWCDLKSGNEVVSLQRE